LLVAPSFRSSPPYETIQEIVASELTFTVVFFVMKSPLTPTVCDSV
jgi:hypothetical protein